MSLKIRNQEGSALVTALFFITGLTVAAAVIAMVATSEKRIAHNEYTHTRSFNASDAGTEEAINWLVLRETPPVTIDADNKVRDLGTYTTLYTSGNYEENKYQYDITFDTVHFRPGWPREYLDYDYTIDAEGASAKESSAMLEVQASRLFRTANKGY
jgi:Tfp pilus assembly protein PilX